MPPFFYALAAFLLVINLTACAAFVIDRYAAANRRPRISPVLLMLCVGLGGGLGMLLAIAPALRDGELQPLSPTVLTVIGLQVGILFGVLTFYVLPGR